MKNPYEFIIEHIEENKPTVIAEIIETNGSTPRGKGTIMSIDKDGKIGGTVGGGNVEYAVIQDAVNLISSIVAGGTKVDKVEQSVTNTYVLNEQNDKRNLNMVCGGAVTVKLDYVEPTGENKWIYKSLYEQEMKSKRNVFVFGGGHIGKSVIPILDSVGFNVVLFNKDEGYFRPEDYPLAKQVIAADYEKVSELCDISDRDFVLIMTRGHDYDYVVLTQILKTNVSYIGMVGSRRKIGILKGYLKEDGFPENSMDRVHIPVGLDIKAETPAEIAVSIAAEMIKIRAELDGEV